MRFLLTIGAVIWLVASSEVEAADRDPLKIINVLTDSANTFASNFYKHVAARQEGNFACSPFSEWMLLSMAAYGARGRTEKEMRTVLEYPEDDTFAEIAFRAFADRLRNYKAARLNATNRMFLNDGFPPICQFRNLTRDIFRSVVRPVDFSNQRTICKPLRAFFRAETSTREKCLQEPIEVEFSTPMVLVSTVYFKSKWAALFFTEPEPQPFYLNRFDQVNVTTMCRMGTFLFKSLDFLNALAFEIPFKSNGTNDALSMFIIWPETVNGLPGLEKNMKNLPIKTLLHGVPSYFKVCLPKFKIESEILLNPVLQDMGIIDMFSPNNANFSEVSTTQPVYATHVVQKTVIEINAGDEEQEQRTRKGPEDPVIFRADHPFMGIIADPSDDSLELIAFRYTGPTPDKFYDSRFNVPEQTFERYLA